MNTVTVMEASNRTEPSPIKLLVENHDDFRLNNDSSQDDVDGLRAKANFNWLDIFCIIVSICSYIADLATDGFIAATYFQTKHYWYFARA